MSLSATPGSSGDEAADSKTAVQVDHHSPDHLQPAAAKRLSSGGEEPPAASLAAGAATGAAAGQPVEHVVDVQVSSPPPNHSCYNNDYNENGDGAAAAARDRSTPLLNRHCNPGNHPLRSAPLASPRTHLRETTKDIVTAVTHHDINGLNAVSTVALKDIDVQMTALSGYETYV